MNMIILGFEFENQPDMDRWLKVRKEMLKRQHIGHRTMTSGQQEFRKEIFSTEGWGLEEDINYH